MNIIKNKAIKKALEDRWKELDIVKMSVVVLDAKERAHEMKITSDRLSKWLSDYKHNGKSAGLSELQIIWLLTRYHIPISLNIGEPKLIGGKLQYIIPKYNELSALKKLKEVFRKTKIEEVEVTDFLDGLTKQEAKKIKPYGKK